MDIKTLTSKDGEWVRYWENGGSHGNLIPLERRRWLKTGNISKKANKNGVEDIDDPSSQSVTIDSVIFAVGTRKGGRQVGTKKSAYVSEAERQ